jgi:ubiquinone/menaquinone biosynthesis C-methylase UbiE
MADPNVRRTESDSIISAIRNWMHEKNRPEHGLRILDAGCGNGTTLSVLVEAFPKAEVIGIELNDELLRVAQNRPNLKIHSGDLRNLDTVTFGTFDVVLTQRVIINIMNRDHQALALNNVIRLLSPDALYIAIEAFESGLDLTNSMRAELGLEPVPMPHHNLFLDDEFFQHPKLIGIDLNVPEYFLSTHYFLSYVLYPALAKAGGVEFKRDNFFVGFLGQLLPNCGEFGANRFRTFSRV